MAAPLNGHFSHQQISINRFWNLSCSLLELLFNQGNKMNLVQLNALTFFKHFYLHYSFYSLAMHIVSD